MALSRSSGLSMGGVRLDRTSTRVAECAMPFGRCSSLAHIEVASARWKWAEESGVPWKHSPVLAPVYRFLSQGQLRTLG